MLSIIIPTRDRPQLLLRAVQSALSQTISDLEVIVVDDASTQPVNLPADPRLRVIRLSPSRGGAAARNAGTEAAQGRWIAYLDDDDCLLPQMAAVSLEALTKAALSPPVAVISGIEVVDDTGKVLETRLPPPSRPRGCHFALEALEPGKSYNTKQTLVVEREVILQLGGWDEAFRSRVHTELFLRLNPVCSILGLPVVTYQLYAHTGARVSRNPSLRQESFQRLIDKHQKVFHAHPQMFANFVYKNALMLSEIGQKQQALTSILRAIQIAPLWTIKQLVRDRHRFL